MSDPEDHLSSLAPLRSELVVLESMRTLATPEEVDFLAAVAFRDFDLDDIPRARETMIFLAGMAVRARNAGTPIDAMWSLVVERKGLDRLEDPDAREFWGRVRRGMRALAEPRTDDAALIIHKAALESG